MLGCRCGRRGLSLLALAEVHFLAFAHLDHGQVVTSAGVATGVGEPLCPGSSHQLQALQNLLWSVALSGFGDATVFGSQTGIIFELVAQSVVQGILQDVVATHGIKSAPFS